MIKARPVSSKEMRRRTIIKWCIYALVIVLCYLYSTVRHTDFPKPVIMLPLCMCIAMKERSELICSMTGVLCGLMTDAAFGKVFGFNAFIFMFVCMFTSLLFSFILRQNILNIIMLCFAAIFFQGVVDYFFYYRIWGYENAVFIFTSKYLPSMLINVILTLPIYFLVKLVSEKMGMPDNKFLEEKDENITRG